MKALSCYNTFCICGLIIVYMTLYGHKYDIVRTINLDIYHLKLL